jgi:hypothetical protein
MTSRERFEYACSLMPPGLCWNEEITPDTVLYIAALVERQALEWAAQRIEPRNAPDDWTEYAKVRAEAAREIRALIDPQSKEGS